MLQLYKNNIPAVSIILPTLNRENLIPRAVKSVLNQSFKDYELIIVDDGSTDRTFQLTDSLLRKFQNIRYTKHSNRGLPLSLNTGISLSAGKYITFLGSDDEYKPQHLELCLNFMQENPDVDLIHSEAEVSGNQYVKDKNDHSKLINLSECIIGGTFFGRREIFFSLNGFKDIYYSEDSEFIERAEGRFTIRKVNFKTYIYHRETPDSITNRI